MALTQKNIKHIFLAVSLTKLFVLIINLVKMLLFTEEKMPLTSLSLMFIEKRPSVVFILTSTASYLKPIKPV